MCGSKIEFLQVGILKRIKEKENEHDSFELQISNLNLSHIDERENKMVSFYADFSCLRMITFILVADTKLQACNASLYLLAYFDSE